MTSTTTLMGYGEMKRREEAAKRRGEKYRATPEVRAEHARILAEREALIEKADAEAKARKEASPTALQAILNRGSIDELAEVARSIGRMDPRRLEELVNETFRAKSRSQAYRPDDEVQAPVASPVPSAKDLAEIAMGAGASVQTSSAGRKR